jgi:HAMP domain-containing protein
MLRRRLFYFFGPLIITLLGTAVAAGWLMERAISHLDALDATSWASLDRAGRIDSLLSQIHNELHHLQSDQNTDQSKLSESVAKLGDELLELASAEELCCQGPALEICMEVRRQIPVVHASVKEILATETGPPPSEQIITALHAVDPLRERVHALSAAVRAHIKSEQAAFRLKLQRTVIAMIVVFLIVINVAVGLILRAASVVVRPIEQLVIATREIGEGRFAHRVEVASNGSQDEFMELSAALNKMAAKLESGQAQQMETLGQIARAMNHEINNVVSIINLQLQLLARQSVAMPELRPRLTQINDCLDRMTRVVRSLQNVRRFVLTDYLPGVKMLDLDQAQLPEPCDRSTAIEPTRTANVN